MTSWWNRDWKDETQLFAMLRRIREAEKESKSRCEHPCDRSRKGYGKPNFMKMPHGAGQNQHWNNDCHPWKTKNRPSRKSL